MGRYNLLSEKSPKNRTVVLKAMLVKGEKKEYRKMMLKLENTWPRSKFNDNTMQERKEEGGKAKK